ncbi:MAG: HEAT repeat domain-containing protein [Holophaga sp.]|nr:HEAT repeat domain-containing protein [Holophaga sp.]
MESLKPLLMTKPPASHPRRHEKGGILATENHPELRLLEDVRQSPSEPKIIAAIREDESLGLEVTEARLREKSPEECQHLLAKFLELGRVSVFSKGIEQVIEGLESTQIETRRWSLETIQALAMSQDQTLIPHGTLQLLLSKASRCLISEPDSNLQTIAVETVALLLGSVAALGDLMGTQSHLAWIIRDAGEAGPELQQRILSSTNLGLAPLRLFFHEGHSVLESRLLPFFRMAGPDSIRGLVRNLEGEENHHRRNRILELLKALAPLSLEPVQESLEAEAWFLVRNALNLLGELGEPDSHEAIRRFLEHPDLRIRRAAVRAFWKTGGLRSEQDLLGLLPKNEAEIQREILVGLGQIRAVSAVDAISQLSLQAEEPFRINCLEALGKIGQPQAIPILAKCLQEQGRFFKTRESTRVREAAAVALMAIGTPEAKEVLARAVQAAPRNEAQVNLRKILERPSWD